MGREKKRLNVGAMSDYTERSRSYTDMINRELAFCDDSVCRAQDIQIHHDRLNPDTNSRHASLAQNDKATSTDTIGHSRPDIERDIAESTISSISDARKNARLQEEIRKRA